MVVRRPDPPDRPPPRPGRRHLVRNRYRGARAFTDAQLAATIREVGNGGACHWCALRVLTAAGDEPMPEQPTPGLVGLLGKPCRRCRGDFDAGQVAKRERAMLAAGYRRRVTGPQPTGAIWPPGLVAAARRATREPLPPFYGSRRIQPPRR